jgi:hypothetical protein
MKIRRRMKNGHEVGNCCIVQKGKWVNLGTKNEKEARKRAAAYLRGDWPPPEEIAEQAADAAKRAEHVPGSEQGNDFEEVQADVKAPLAPPALPGGNPDTPRDVGPGVSSESEPDAAEQAAAAAADAEGVSAAGAPADDEQSKRSAWAAKFQSMFGADASGGVSPGKAVTAGTVYAVGFTMDRIGRKAKPPRYLAFDVEKHQGTLGMMAMAWDEQIRRWGLDLASIEPWHAILLSNAMLVGAMAFSFADKPPSEDAQATSTPGGEGQ